jgi:predicted TIM-barrel fold metal-dependent hydrolase
MIIDIHTHVGIYKEHFSESFARIFAEVFEGEPHELWTVKPEVFISDMDEADVDKIVIQGSDLTRVDPGTKIDDEYIYNTYVKKYPDRFIGFSGIQPINSAGRFSSERLAQFKKAITEYGFRGMKAHPCYSNYPPNDRTIYPFYQAANELKVPVLLHMGSTGYTPANFDYGNPKYLDDVALDFPKLKICAAHMAYPWQKQLFGLMRKCRNIYTDISALCARPMELAWHLVLAKDYGLMDRVLWGTDYPVCNPKKFIDWIKNDLNEIVNGCGWPTFSDQEINQILGENAIKFLGLGT